MKNEGPHPGFSRAFFGDNDGVYHPALFNDRLLLGIQGAMSEAELHIIRVRLDGGIRNQHPAQATPGGR